MNRIILLLTLLLATPTMAADDIALKGNPFSRPPSDARPETSGVAVIDGPVPQIDLQATMVGTGKGLANVAGRILKPGQTIEGLTLVKVYEDRAVFMHRGERLTVYVKPDLNESDDED